VLAGRRVEFALPSEPGHEATLTGRDDGPRPITQRELSATNPRDTEDHEGNRQADEGVGDRRAECYERSARNDAERNRPPPA
jgi:hypothetical protein